MTLRLLQAALLLLVVGVGYAYWADLPQPATLSMEDLAAEPLRRIFGDEMRYAELDVDLVEGVRIQDLRVPSQQGLRTAPTRPGEQPRAIDGFTARTVEIRQDTLALSTGAVALRSVSIEGARIMLRETADGIASDFTFDMPQARGNAPPPELTLDDAWLYVRSMPGSTRFSEAAVLVLYVESLRVRSERGGRLRVSGTVFTRELGQDDEPLKISGRVDMTRRTLDLRVDIEHVTLTPNLLALLAETVAAPLRQESIKSGTLGVTLSGPIDGDLDMSIEWDADVEVQVEDIPGIETIEATTKEQLQELFGRGAMKLLVDQDQVRIDTLVTQMAGGRVQATGWIKHATGAMRIDFTIDDLNLEDDAVRRALGEEGAELFDQFSPKGIVDAKGTVTRDEDGEIEWSVDVVLEDTSFEFVGHLTEDGSREGFPYLVEQATGRAFLRPGKVYFEDIVGFHRGAEVTLRGRDKKSWDGGETGRILFTDQGTDIRLTVEVVNMRVDEDLERAVAGSEFAGIFDTFQLAGILDKVEIDVIRIPGTDRFAKGEIRLQLEGEQFKYAPFPMPVEDVRGTIIVERPVLPGEGEGNHRRGRRIAFDVTGWLEGAPIRAKAEIIGHEDTGRLFIEADGVPLAGALTRTILTADETKDGLAPVWAWLEPRGRADVVASIPLRADPKPMELTTTLKGASIRLDAAESPAPIELADLSGKLEVKGDEVRFEGVSGKLLGSPTTATGTMLGGPDGRWDLTIDAEPVRLTSSLLAGLTHLTPDGNLLPDGMRFEPGGRLGFKAKITREPGPDSPLDLELTATNVDVDVRMPKAGVVHVSGEKVHVGPDAIAVTNVDVQTEGLTIVMEDARIPRGEGGALQGTFELRMDAFEPTEGVLDMISSGAAEIITSWTKDRLLSSKGLKVVAPGTGPVRLEGPLSLVVPEGVPVSDGPRGALTLAPLSISTDEAGTLLGGRVVLQGFSIDVGVELTELYGTVHVDRLRLGEGEGGNGRLIDVRGQIEGVRVAALSTPLSWQDGILRADPVTARVADGAFQGHVFVHTREPTAFEGAARITDFDLAKLQEDLAPTGAPVSGIGNAEVRFQSRGETLRDLTAAGTVRIRNGSLGDLPFVATIFAMGARILNSDNRPQFESADVEFVLKDEVFELKRIDLAGPLFEMPGRGTLDTTGVVDLYFTPDFIKSLVLPGVMQLPVIGDVVGGVLREELLYAVRVHGDISNAQTELLPLPALGIDFGSDFEGTGPRKLPRRRVPRWFR
ncbi:MAG: AsmA-like C-terminal region-containing protein [Planctomycetota bacterium]|nr:AsmA-like C-terminal region-containing protein [Planctomycetota bacterium]